MKEDNPTNLLKKKRVLLFADWFDPAYKAGGPIRSCVNFVLNMQDVLDIYVLTSDRDLGATTSLNEIETGRWVNYGDFAKVYYATPSDLTWNKILTLIKDIDPAYIYCNSLFSKYFTIYPLLYRRFNKINAQIVLSPRGMLKPSALAFKSQKKKVFLSLFKKLRIPKFVSFHATDPVESKCLQDVFGKKVKTREIGNFPEFIQENTLILEKETGILQVLFVGRIHKIKNLLFLLESLQHITGRLHLEIVGVKEDEVYWQECEAIIQGLPKKISVKYLGEQPHHEVHDVIQRCHVFCLPTQGENFGHAIFEALACGKPVIISDQTPWRQLENNKSGFDLPLREEDFCNALQEAMNWSQNEYNLWSKGALQLARNYVTQSNLKEKYLTLFS